MTEKVLITGITGFVGSHLADLALEKGVEVHGLKRWNLSRLRNVQHLMDRVQFHDCDLTDPIGIRDIIKEVRPQKIFHMAAESFVSPSWKHPSHYMDVNYNGTINLFEACRVVDVDCRIHLPGSGEEYGEISEDDLPINEKTVLHPVNPYAVSKVAQDFIGYVYYKSYGTKVIRTRAFNHEGPRRDYVFGIAWYAYQLARIEAGKQKPVVTTGHLDDRRNFTHIRDMVEAYWLAMEKCEPGKLYVIGSDENEKVYTFREALQELIKLSKLDNVEITQDPKLVRPTNVPRLIADTAEFRALTGWKPTIPFTQILQDTLDYWRDFVQENKY